MAVPSLYPYQMEGVKFLIDRPAILNKKPHRLLADDPGLGKTAQAITATKMIGAKNGIITCPASIKYNWARQMVMWGLCHESDIFIVKTKKDVIPADAKFVIVNYELVIVPEILKQLKARKWAVIILDEAHKLKALDSMRSKLILGRLGLIHNCYHKYLLTGTPIPNRPIEFFTVLSTLAPEIIKPYESYYAFGKHFCKGFFDRYEGWNFKGASNIPEFRERLKPFMLRRRIDDVYKQLPPVVPNVVYLDVDISQHPECQGLENPYEPDRELPGATVRRIVGEIKLPDAVEYICDLLETNHKVFVFAYHRNVIETLTREMAAREFNPITIYGGLTSEKKQWLVDRFVDDPTIRVGIGQIVASGEGVDGLQKVCNVMVHVELDWVPGMMEQNTGRLKRIGQTKPVFTHYLIARNTHDTIIAGVLERKSAVINEIMKGNNTTMTIEAKLDRTNELLEQVLDALKGGATTSAPKEEKAKGGKGKKTETEAAPEGTTGKSKYTMKDVRDACQKFINGNKKVEDIKAQASKIIKEIGGGANLSDLENHPQNWDAVIDAFNAGPVTPDAGDDEFGDLDV